ncbi:MAG: hypothetical protein HC880_05030 [Bacteroidia bacterium]|nr:hypothetical protein [Bacteroidia bacterium]
MDILTTGSSASKVWMSSHSHESQAKWPLIYLLVWGAFMGLGFAFYYLAFTTRYLEVYGFVNLPQAFLIAGFLGVLVSVLFAGLQVYASFARLAIFLQTLVFLGVSALYYGLLHFPQQEMIFQELVFWGFVGIFPLQNVLLLSFEGVFGRIFNIQQTKHLADRANAGFMLAGMLAFYAIPSLRNYLGFQTRHFIWWSSLGLFLALLVLIFIVFKFSSLSAVQQDIKEIKAKNTFFQLIERKYLILLACLLLLGGVTGLFIEYLFLRELTQNFTAQNEQAEKVLQISELTNFLAVFCGVGLSLEFLIKIFLYRYVTGKFNLKIGLLILPISLLVFLVLAWGTAWFVKEEQPDSNVFIFLFIMLSVSKLIKDALGEAIQMPVFRLCLLPIDINLRFDIQVKLEGVVRSLAFWLGGVLLLLFAFKWLFLIIELSFVLLLLGISLYVIFLVYREYKKTLEDTLTQQQSEGSTHSQHRYQCLADRIVNDIYRIHPTQLAIYLNLLRILDSVAYRTAILKLLDSRDQSIDKLLRTVKSKINQTLKAVNPSLHALLFAGETDSSFPTRYDKLPQEEAIRDLVLRIDKKVQSKNLDDAQSSEALQLKHNLQDTYHFLREEMRKIALDIHEEIQKAALLQAGKLCILESIPMLDIIIQSKYFPVLNHAELIQDTSKKLRGAEFRLERLKYIKQLTLSKQLNERIFGALLTTYSAESIKKELLYEPYLKTRKTGTLPFRSGCFQLPKPRTTPGPYRETG